MIVDLGTGDGRAVLARAVAEPRSLVIGIDAAATGMAESSRRAARPPSKGGLPNALFIVAAAECPPPELFGLAAEVAILFPWGSLLRGVLGDDPAVAAGVASLLSRAGRVVAIVSVTDRDGAGSIDAERIITSWRAHGLALRSLRPASPAEVDASDSTWARRLRVGRDRMACRLELGDFSWRSRSAGRAPVGRLGGRDRARG